jgi:hypothetical protein
MPPYRPALIAPVLARPDVSFAGTVLGGALLAGAGGDTAAGAAGVLDEAGALGVSLEVPPQLVSHGGGGGVVVPPQLVSHGGGGGVVVPLEDVHPVCAGFVRPMPWLRSHS